MDFSSNTPMASGGAVKALCGTSGGGASGRASGRAFGGEYSGAHSDMSPKVPSEVFFGTPSESAAPVRPAQMPSNAASPPLLLPRGGRRPRPQSLKERLGDSHVKNVHVHLPESAQVLQSVIQNNDSLLQLIGHFGGCTLRVPAQWPPHGQKANYKGHPLRRVLSSSQMQRMVSHYGGTDLYVPKCTQHILRLRNKALTDSFCKETRRGQSTGHVVQKLARRYHISDRRVWAILKDSAED